MSKFNRETEDIRNAERESLYNTFYVEKHGKGMPYVFKQIFAKQSHYIGGDTTEVFRAVGTKVRELLSQHSTEKDKDITDSVAEYCVQELTKNGFDMTTDDFQAILKSAYRRIDAPKEELKAALYHLKAIFEDVFGALYHTSAFAYIKKRSTLDAIKRHQSNNSRWFAKYDLSNFFGSTTVEFIMNMFSTIFPFSEVVKYTDGKAELEKALSLCVLRGVLPQGTPISPIITNIMMIPIDHKLSNTLRDYKNQRYIYTRYADDFLISSEYTFDFRDIEQLLVDTLREFNAPFTVNQDKTRYGSSAGSNWNLGVMLNKDNQITVGYKKKRQFQAMLSSYVMDKRNGVNWDKGDVRTMEGYRNYYRMIEGDTIDKIVAHIGQKFNVDIMKMIKDDLRI